MSGAILVCADQVLSKSCSAFWSIAVYDITVDGEHEFFANGVLVHNSTEDGGG